ncbi:TraR/DksA family transcriptional regulator [Streptomyces sp. NPDC029080]|uniref:TraR/DksA family transcriptional regulator n=1 Tax=unclassified Streptomyces TaxID=2593676 RepID=UPI001927BA66|nr:TraR/DksA family transcriptional regulator [Streptomyces sp. SID486]
MVAKKTAVQQPATGKTGAGPATGKTAAGSTAARKTAAGRTAATKTATGRTAATKTAAGSTAATETAATKAATGRTAATKTAATRANAENAAVTEKVAKKTVAKKAVGKKTAAKKAVAKKAVAKKAVAKKAVAKKVTTEKGTGHKVAERDAAGKSTAKKAGAAHAAEQTGATTVVAKKTPGTATTEQTAVPKARIAAAEPGELAVRPGEDPWTEEEVAEARAELQSEMERLREEISSSEASLVGLMRDSGDGAGDDQADTGTKNITREHELALAANAREMLTQTERALERLDAGTYGLCENCGNPIGKARMQAFPRATLCVECKQKQERRS